jgi:hypothetical protein
MESSILILGELYIVLGEFFVHVDLLLFQHSIQELATLCAIGVTALETPCRARRREEFAPRALRPADRL